MKNKYLFLFSVILIVFFLSFISSAEGDYTGTTYDTSSIGLSGLFTSIAGNSTFIWGTDGTPLHNVYKLWQNGTYTNEYFTTSGAMSGITMNNTFIWIFSDGVVSKFWINGTNTSEMFVPNVAYSCSRGITTNGSMFWLNCGSNGNAIRIYWINGTYYGTFNVNTEIVQGRGIYTNNIYIWITDDTTDEVYRYFMNGTYTGQHWDTAISGNIGPKSITMDDTYFYVSDTINETIFLYYGYPDTISPYFITIPNNSSLIYLDNLSVDFDATDVINFGYYSINDTKFKIFQNGTLTNNQPLSAGNYEINVTINDSSNNIDWVRYTIQVNKSQENCQVLFNETSPLEYTKTFKVYTNCSSPVVLMRNGTTIINNSEQDLSISAYNFSFTRNDTSNYTYIYNESQFIITDTTSPTLTIIEPKEGESFTSSSIDLNFSVSDDGIGLDSCWYQNHTGSNVTINCSLNTTISQSGDGTYTIYMWANDTYGNLATDIHTWTVSATAPAINLIHPSNNEYFDSGSNVELNFTATDSNGISSCQLWTNTTGIWHKNQTITSITSGVETNFSKINLGDGYYKWNVWCNDSTGLPNTDSWATINRTFTIDTTYPQISFTTANSSTFTSLSVTIEYAITEINKDDCTFVLRNSTGDLHNYVANTTISCSLSSYTISTLEYGTFSFQLWVKDEAGNINQSIIFFTNEAPPSNTTTIGGGGTTIVISGNLSWTMTTETGGDRYQFNILQGSSRSKDILFQNSGSDVYTIELSCEYVAGAIDLCQDLTYEYQIFELPVETGVKTPVQFLINVPSNYEEGQYIINLVATDNNGGVNILSTEIDIGTGRRIVDIPSKLLSNKYFGDVKIPYALIFIVIWIILSVIFSYVFKQLKLIAYTGVGVITGLFLSLIAIIFI